MAWIETPESSNITRFSYDEGSMVLTIEFKKTSAYQYFEVPEAAFQGMVAAASKGEYFAKYVRGKFRYAKV